MAEFKLRGLKHGTTHMVIDSMVGVDLDHSWNQWHLRRGNHHWQCDASELRDLDPTIKADIDWPTFATIARLPEWVARTLYDRVEEPTPACKRENASWDVPGIGWCNERVDYRCDEGVDSRCISLFANSGCRNLIPAEPKETTTTLDVVYACDSCGTMMDYNPSTDAWKCQHCADTLPRHFDIKSSGKPEPTESTAAIIAIAREHGRATEHRHESRLQDTPSYSPHAVVCCQSDEDGDI